MKRSKIVIGTVGAVLLLLISIFAWQRFTDSNRLRPVSDEELGEAIYLAAQYLEKQIEADGRFVYRVNANSKIEVPDKYNVLRHAGAIYSLAMYLKAYPNEDFKAKTLQATKYLIDNSLGPVRAAPGTSTLWSTPEILRDPKFRPQSKLGGAGLGLVALVSSYHLDPSVIAKEKLIEVGRFLEFMQMKDGNFHSKYFPDKEGRSNAWVSLYYPGEAALGAVMLYAIDPDVRWLTISAKGLSYLANKRKGQGTNVEADHWALLATKGLLYHLDEFEDPPAPREMLIEHGKQIVRKMLEDFDSVSSRSVAYGGSTRDGRTTPTATRLEGLLAAYEFLPDSEAELKAEVLRICELGIAFLIKHQIRQEGPFKGAIPRAIGPVKKGKDRKSIRQFNQRATEIRIDYVQHALSAMLQLRDIRQKARP